LSIFSQHELSKQGEEKRRERWRDKARKGEVGLAGMGGLPTNSQKAEFTDS
jgi:hypothetical protein